LKTNFIIIFLLILAVSCRPEVTDNERWLIKGNVTDPSGNPLENIKISTEGHLFKLGKDFTDENGKFEFTSLAFEGGYFEVHVNADSTQQNGGQKNWSTAAFYFSDTRNHNQIFEIDNIQLRPAAHLNLKIVGNPEISGNIKFRLNYISNVHIEVLDLEDNDFFENNQFFSRTIPLNQSFSKEFHSLLNTDVILTYRINDGNETQITIPLTETENTYVLQL